MKKYLLILIFIGCCILIFNQFLNAGTLRIGSVTSENTNDEVFFSSSSSSGTIKFQTTYYCDGSACETTDYVDWYLSREDDCNVSALGATDYKIASSTVSTITSGGPHTLTSSDFNSVAYALANGYKYCAGVVSSDVAGGSSATEKVTVYYYDLDYPSSVPFYASVPITINISNTFVRGEDVTLTKQIQNNGKGKEVSSVDVTWFVSSDNDWDAADTQIGSTTISSFASQTTTWASGTFEIPQTITSDAIYFIAYLDKSGAFTEIDETDNDVATGSFALASQTIDLEANTMADPTSPATAGVTLTLTAQVDNDGNIPSGAFTADWYLSTNSTITTSDTKLGSTNVAEIVGAATKSVSDSFKVPSCKSNNTSILSGATGSFYYGIMVDPSGSITESNEANNVKANSSAREVKINRDLTPSGFSVPDYASGGYSISVTVPVENGGKTDSCAFKVSWYMCVDQTATGTQSIYNKAQGSAPSCWLLDGLTSITNVAGETSTNVSGTPVIPASVATGTSNSNRYVFICVDYEGATDYDGTLYETNDYSVGTDDNCLSADNVTVVSPASVDLEPQSFTAPISGLNGETITFSVPVTNNGTNDSGSFVVQATLGTSVATTTMSSLGAGSSSNASFSLQVGCSETSVSTNIIVQVDPDGLVPESDESNNSIEASNETEIIEQSFDIEPTLVTIPSFGTATEEIEVTASLINNGTVDVAPTSTGPCTTSWYLSTNAIITTSDALLKVSTVTVTLPVDTSKDISTKFDLACNNSSTINPQVPCDMTGNTYIGVMTACIGVTKKYSCGTISTESNTNNNVKASASTINITTPAVDLYLRDVKASPITATETIYWATATVEMQKSKSIDALFDVYWYLSTDTTINSSDTLLAKWENIQIGKSTDTVKVGSGTAIYPYLGPAMIPIPATITRGYYYIGSIVDPSSEITETDETNNALAYSTQINILGPQIDLKPQYATSTVPITAGNYASLTVSILNEQGAGENVSTIAAGTIFYVDWYLSTDNDITTSDSFLGSDKITIGITGLAANASTSQTKVVTIPANTTSGSYYFGAIVDSHNEIIEIDETNNKVATGSVAVNVERADLKPVAGTISFPRYAAPSGKIGVAVGIQNNNITPSGNFSVGWYLVASNTVQVPLPSTVPYVLIGTTRVSSIPGKQSKLVYDTPTLPSAIDYKDYYGLAYIDVGNEVEEDNSDNGINTYPTTITIRPAEGDLTATSISAPSEGFIGNKLTLTATVKYTGSGQTGDFYVGWYLSKDNIIKTDEDVFLGSYKISNIIAGANANITESPTIPASVSAGKYYAGIVVDLTYSVPETNEENNTLAASTVSDIKVPAIDLVPLSVQAPSFASAGLQISMLAEIRNSQTNPSGDFSVRWYLSDNTIITTEDTLLGSQSVTSINGGDTKTVNVNITISSQTASGTYYIGIFVDSGQVIDETNETNNTKASDNTTTVYGSQIDLLGNSLSLSKYEASAGSKVTVSLSMENAGLSNTSKEFDVDWYMSSDTTITSSDIYVGRKRVTQNINGYEGLTVSDSPTIPSNATVGQYYFGVIIDSQNVIGESNESNNTKATSMTLNVTTAVATGAILVKSTPSGGKIYVDGADTGLITEDAGTTISDLSVGNHTVMLQLLNYACSPMSQLVNVEANKTKNVTFTCSLVVSYMADTFKMGSTSSSQAQVTIPVTIENATATIQIIRFSVNTTTSGILSDLRVTNGDLIPAWTCSNGAEGILCSTDNANNAIPGSSTTPKSGIVANITWDTNCSSTGSQTAISLTDVQFADTSNVKGTAKQIVSGNFFCSENYCDPSGDGNCGGADDVNLMIQCVVGDIEGSSIYNLSACTIGDTEYCDTVDLLLMINCAVGNISSIPADCEWRSMCGQP